MSLLGRVKKEYQLFHSKPVRVRRLLITYFLYSLNGPFIAVFTNAFLWRETERIDFIAIYNIAFCLCSSLGYYISGHIIKRVSAKTLFMVGTCLRTMMAMAVIFFSTNNIVNITILGILTGLSVGLYWSTRDFFTLAVTDREDRVYFNSVQFISDGLAGIAIPLVIGYVITLGDKIHLYSAETGYKLVALVVFVNMILMTWVFHKIALPRPKVTQIILVTKDRLWLWVRIANVVYGLIGNLFGILPVLLILFFIGKEDSLGALESAATVFSVVVIYIVGKKVSLKHRKIIVLATMTLFIIGTLGLLFGSTLTGVIIYDLSFAMGWPLFDLHFSSLVEDAAELKGPGDAYNYPYIFDIELFADLGTAFGFLILAVLTVIAGPETALKFMPIMLIFALAILLYSTEKANYETEHGYYHKQRKRR